MRRLSALLIVIYSLFNPLKITSAEEPQKTVLDNGLTIIVNEVPSTGLIALDLRVKAGSVYEGAYAGSGISHFVEHMIFKGTNRHHPGEIEKKIRSLGGAINGATTYDYTSFTITIPKEEIRYALDILSDSLFNPIMDPKEFERERNVILKEIKLNTDDPTGYLTKTLWGTVYNSHPYRHPVIGYEPLFNRLAREDLIKYHKKMYVPNNMVLALVGDISAEDALGGINGYFKHIEMGRFEADAVTQERTQLSKRVRHLERELQMAYFALGYRSVGVDNSDMPAMDILAAILGLGESSRLTSTIYRTKNLVYSIGAWNYTPADPGIFVISGVAEPKKLTAALGAIGEEINNIKTGGINSGELEKTKAMITAEYVHSLQTLSGQARDLATSEILTADFNFTKKYLERINAVTAEDVARVAGIYMDDDSLSLVTIAPHSEGTPSARKEKEGRKGIEKITLDNGLRCLLMEDKEAPIVSMIAVSLAGLRAEDENTSGISNLTGAMMLKGTREHSEEEIARMAESMGARLDYFSGNNSLGIRLDILSKDIERGFEFFREILTEPAFPEEVTNREKNSVMAMIKATEDDIFETGMKKFKETLYKVHPYRFQNLGTITSVNGLKPSDLEGFYKKYFISDNMVVAIFGNIDASEAKKMLKDGFSSIERRAAPKFAPMAEPKEAEIRHNISSIAKEQSLVIMGFKGATLQGEDRYALQVINAALSGISGRLSARLREKLGIAYMVGALSVPSLDPGYFIFYIATTSDNIERAEKEFLHQTLQLNKNGLSAEELASAKSELIGNQLIALETPKGLAYQSALDELYGLGYDNYLKFADAINSLTNQDIIEVSQRYLSPDDYALVVVEGRDSD